MKEESKLLRHARREFEIMGGEDDLAKKNVMDLLRVFDGAGHSGSSGVWVLGVFERLADWKNLAPLTRNPNEWEYAWTDKKGNKVYQNTRCSSIFSEDPEFKRAWDCNKDFGNVVLIGLKEKEEKK